MMLNHYRTGSGEPLVLIHGIGSRWQMWGPVLDRLAAEREVVAIDLPGFGGSPPPPPGTPAGIGSMTRLVDDFIAQLRLTRPHVAGNSLGGWVSLELAKQGRVRSAAALSPAGFHTSLEGRFQHTSLWLTVRAARRLSGLNARRDVLARPRARMLVFGQYIAKPQNLTAPEALESIQALAEAPWFDDTLPAITRDRFGGGEQIKVPVTVAWGEEDRLLLPRQAQRARREIPSARVVTLFGCGHVPTYDDPEQVARVLLDASADGGGAGAGAGAQA